MEYGVVFLWWLTIVGFAIAGLPIAATFLDRLPDRGASVALPCSLLLFGLTVYWIGHLSFGPLAIGGGILVLGGLSIVTVRRGPTIEYDRFLEWLLVFSLAYLLLVLVRVVDPSVVPVGGERLLDYGLVNTHLRADQLPAEDFWLAGEHLRYYFGGHMLVAALSMLTTVPAKFAFNLGVATSYAALVAGVYGVAGGIVANRGGSFRVGGALAAIFVGVSSNLAPVLQGLLEVLPNGLATDIASWVAERSALSVEWLLGDYWAYYWAPSRVIGGTINEFPFFAWYNGDLHAHMLSQPFLVLAIALAFAYFLTPADRVLKRRGLLFGAMPLVAGWLALTNTWSMPTAAGVGAIAAYFAPSDPADMVPTGRLDIGDGPDSETRRLAGAASVFLGVLFVAVLWILPYVLIPERPAGVAEQLLGVVTARSTFVELLLVHGWMLAIFAGYLWTHLEDRLEQPATTIALLAGLILASAVLQAAAFGLVLPVGLAAWYLLRRVESPVGFETALIVAGAGLVLLVELVFLQDQAGAGRFNTVFKSYAHVWVLWGIGAAAALATLITGRLPTLEEKRRRQLWSVFAVFLVVSTGLYAGITLGSHFQDTSVQTLDGTNAIQEQRPLMWEATQYFDGLDGQPNVATPPVGPYDWGSAPPSFTGVPTLITGMHHVSSFQGQAVVDERLAAVERIYTGTPEQRATALRRYDVEYVWLGPSVHDRNRWGPITLEAGPGLEAVFENRRVTIYRVRADQLPERGASQGS